MIEIAKKKKSQNHFIFSHHWCLDSVVVNKIFATFFSLLRQLQLHAINSSTFSPKIVLQFVIVFTSKASFSKNPTRARVCLFVIGIPVSMKKFTWWSLTWSTIKAIHQFINLFSNSFTSMLPKTFKNCSKSLIPFPPSLRQKGSESALDQPNLTKRQDAIGYTTRTPLAANF